jgi:uncharacterized protein (DUF2141 family)
MKTVFTILAFYLTSFAVHAQDKANVSVTIDNVLNNKGKVLFSLHNKDTFMKTQPIAVAVADIENGKTRAQFKDVTPGIYAVLVLHDENENNQMDFEPNGMPKESYAVSNNPMSFGPPQFSEAQFEVKSTDIELQLRF